MFAQEKTSAIEPTGAFRQRIRPLEAAAGGFCLVVISRRLKQTS
jgi:hypothetical protein